MPPKYARLAGLGAFGACAGLLGLFLGLVYITRPARLSGIDGISAAVTWIALGGLFAALIIAHVAIGKQLMRLGQGENIKHPL